MFFLSFPVILFKNEGLFGLSLGSYADFYMSNSQIIYEFCYSISRLQTSYCRKCLYFSLGLRIFLCENFIRGEFLCFKFNAQLEWHLCIEPFLLNPS